jgi:DnaJ-class molecular chaperone
MNATLYEVLGIPETATASEIKAAFRLKAKETHPDRNGGSRAAAARFRAVCEAHEVLADTARRSEYDRRLALERARPERQGPERQSPRPPPRPSAGPSAAELFGGIFLGGILGVIAADILVRLLRDDPPKPPRSRPT